MSDVVVWLVLLAACWSVSVGVAKLVVWFGDQAHARLRRRYAESVILAEARRAAARLPKGDAHG